MTQTQAPALQQINPAELLLGTNVREHATLDKGFKASIKECGVLSPIVAVQADDGLTVRYGQRRTLAAVEAGLDSVPVVVVPADTDDEAARIIEQLAENDHRADVADTDRTAAYEQLAAFGWSATKIARKTHRPKAEVQAAQTVAASQTARDTVAQHDALTLDDAVLVAEFDDDQDVVDAIVQAAKDGQSTEHVAARARREKAAQQARAAVAEQLAEAGVTVIDEPRTEYDQETYRMVQPVEQNVTDLRMSKDTTGPMTADEHADCPGHAAYIARSGWSSTEYKAVYVCTDPKANGHRRITAAVSAPMTDEQKAERAQLIANNKEWDASGDVRGDWIAKNLPTGKTAPKGAEKFLAACIAHGDHIDVGWQHDTAPLLSKMQRASAARALRLAVHALLADWHTGTTGKNGRSTWRFPTNRDRRYMAALIGWGYPASDLERTVAQADD